MLFYHVQLKTDDLRVNIREKASAASVNRAGASWGQGALRLQQAEPLKKLAGSKEHLDWLKIDLNAAKIITAQDYKQKKINVNGSTHIQQC